MKNCLEDGNSTSKLISW